MPGRDLVASSSASTWAPSTSCCRSSRRSRSPRGLQRIGRAGHNVGDTSKGRIFPKFRADLLECAVVAQRMREGLIETTVVPRNPLDVLAQQIVAMAASADDEDQPLHVDDLHALLGRTHSFAELSRAQLENVLDMLDGRYPSEEFGELRPRIVWDRVAGTLRARKGSRALAITNAGTIPDRGLFGVNLPDGRRVGELDEEMVYEARPGQTFLLGATSLADRGDHARPRDRLARARRPRRGAVLAGRRRRAARASSARRSARSRAGRSTRTPRRWRRATTSTTSPRRTCSRSCASSRTPRASSRATARSSSSASATRSATGACASSRPFGGRVHAAWGLALSARIRDEYGLESDAIWSDDGIIVHLPDADEPPGAELVLIDPDELEDARRRRARRLGAVRRALPRERRPRAADPARLPRPAHAAVAAAAEVADAARGRQALRAVPDRARDLPRVPARRARRARPAGPAAQAALARARRWSRSRRRPPRRSPPRCCSTTSRPTCTRATRPTPSGAPPRWRSTASCCASCSARRSCAS